ncbi:alpha/beta hydrolase [Actinomadura rupiterrae]|uniref:alpha/beta hydrolase n=1 Tax=Actinomadura rupiterrae TaxID=559627 RepID=UPI0020A58F81|nr:alpha/beta hydrolase [Actinomadura rupiterrae]MCP2342913.1 pimeloyl-ACP methyl ester carboxylesterase [Actinomadura rupiterrae]
MRTARWTSAIAALTLMVATGCDGGGSSGNDASASPRKAPPGLETFYGQKPNWKSCGSGMECADIKVPLNYSEPSRGEISLAAIRLPAEDKSQRIGSLLTNPGGPGGSGVDFVRQTGRAFDDKLRQRFDIVGFDPRGVGKSAPVRCMTGPELDRFFGTDTSPDDQREVDTLASESRQYAQACKTKASNELPYVGTASAARDMDVLRAALGDQKLTYYGASYGTYLGATYADEFPTNIRALVLDGAIDPRTSSTDMLIEQAKGFETALRAFAADCAKQGDCPLGTDPDAGVAKIGALLKQTDRTPLRNSRDSRQVTESWTAMGIATALYAKETWPFLRQALSSAFTRGDGTLLMTLADQMVERKPDGTYSNQTDANMAVNCVDKPNPADVATYKKSADQAAQSSPRFGPFVVWGGLPCVYWPVQTKQQPRPVNAKGAPPILVIGTLRDPATPYKWAQGLASQLSSGRLLTLDGDGHTAYLQGNPCITAATDDYLVKGTPPKKDTVCR